ncbi:class I SAM-dependent DNA methyltransferase [Zhongshania sp. BJYM1]|uniref:class I SAM-dependent DNA methyltransferase n=1 Tax=Zhongshania aquatica TaxID=2965069 RepID=UPI0022B55ABA|nr:DNA methyltransferase [Marortus sp. BJYM1]
MEVIADPIAIDNFLNRWKGNSGSERSNFQSFMRDLCTLLELPLPEPGEGDTSKNSYVFERFIASARVDGNTDNRFIDLYRRDCFILEGKQTGKELASLSHQNAINAAVAQAERYIRGLPQSEIEHGRPPFIVVVDVGNAIYTFSEFTRTGGNYVPFPDPRSYEIRLDDLHDPEIQNRLRQLWLDPEKLDPSKRAALVTKQVSTKLAELAKSLEQSGYDVERVASFLKRCLFTMFAEDVELLPESSFHDLLVDVKDRNPEAFPHAVKALWETMNTGGYSERLMKTIKRFNGGLFKDIDPIPLDVDQIQLLIDAAKADWRFVEPAIFGTLLERALDPRERHKLGAHYTPRAYVERLVMPTLIDPLREQWGDVRGAAETLLRQGKQDKALQEIQGFHYRLCQIRVLDPACGSANFLYVALEHMKRLEGEVLGFLSELTQGQALLEGDGLTVDPHQFLGLEINPRAAQIAELVLWIGYLQWHYRLNDRLDLPEPILRDFKNIECRDALITYDSRDLELDVNGDPVTIWDGISMKRSPTTGELIPDEAGRAPVYSYDNPRQAEWPEADYILGNPPFIGKLRIRSALGGGYVDALRQAYKGEVPDSVDFVMYWWAIAANKLRDNRIQRFGFITTNSISQTYNRRVLEPRLKDATKAISLVFAVPDHPWVDGNNGAAVRISMTACESGIKPGVLNIAQKEVSSGDFYDVVFSTRIGHIYSTLTIGADISSTKPLTANSMISATGVIPHGSGMLVHSSDRHEFERDAPIRPYLNGKDVSGTSRGLYVIDCYGLSSEQVLDRYPKLYQWLLNKVKPERDVNRDSDLRKKWWLHRRNNDDLRASLRGLKRYIATVMTAKHRLFVFLDGEVLPDQMLVNIGSDSSYVLGVLSSRLHIAWALSAGGRLGVGNDSRYNKTRCFETFPFPAATNSQENGIGVLAGKLDALRKQQQSEYPGLTLTGMYNVLEKLRADEELSEKEKILHRQGLVSVLLELHDELDRAVFNAYGWADLADRLVGRPGATTLLPDKRFDQMKAEEELLIRMVELNKRRIQDEAQGLVHWLRAEFQAPDSRLQQADITHRNVAAKLEVASSKGKATFPKAIPEQLRLLREELAQRSHTTDSLAELFKRKPIKSVEEGLKSLVAVGVAEHDSSAGTWHLV